MQIVPYRELDLVTGSDVHGIGGVAAHRQEVDDEVDAVGLPGELKLLGVESANLSQSLPAVAADRVNRGVVIVVVLNRQEDGRIHCLAYLGIRIRPAAECTGRNNLKLDQEQGASSHWGPAKSSDR